jgi:SAM-dependent methyltransferase
VSAVVDWEGGRYELVGEQLLPAAVAVVDRAALSGDERVVDVGCGTGNAALLAAERGAAVTGVDPAQRLLEVAAADASARGLTASFVRAEAAAMPLADGTADVVMSVFGVVFAPDAAAAAAELARVTAPGGRILLTAWISAGPLSDVRVVRREALAAAGVAAESAPFAWEDRDALTGLLEPLGFSVELEERELAFHGHGSPREFVELWFREHPLWIADHARLGPLGVYELVRDRTIDVFAAANEDPAGFRVTAPYVLATARRG